MSNSLNTYSRVLQMRSETLEALIKTQPGYIWSLKMFVVVMLIAGLGLWFGVGEIMSRITVVEGLDAIAAGAQTVEGAVQGALSDVASGDVAAAPAGLLAAVQAQAAPLLMQLQGALSGLGGTLAETPVALEGDVAGQAREAALERLAPVAEGLSMEVARLAELLAEINVTPEQVLGLMQRFGLDPAVAGKWLAAAEITEEEINGLFNTLRNSAANTEPLLGTRVSRIIRLGGEWLSSPLTFAANWIFFILALMLAARSLGGRGSIRDHLAAALLASAPLILAFGLFIPPVAAAMGIPIALALRLSTRMLALIGIIWALLLLIRTVATAHEFSNWRSVGAIALTLVGLFVLLPLAALLASGFLFAF